jgi:hypothetical protein
MISDITKIQLSELIEDREASVKDISECGLALRLGVTRYGGVNHDEKSVQDRIDGNIKIIEVIDAELKRRNVQIIKTQPVSSV